MKFRFRKKEELVISLTPLVVVAGLVAVLYLFRKVPVGTNCANRTKKA